MGNVLDQHGRWATYRDPADCTHGVRFDEDTPGATPAAEVRAKFPRLTGPCPLGCGFSGIAYASMRHYVMGDW